MPMITRTRLNIAPVISALRDRPDDFRLNIAGARLIHCPSGLEFALEDGPGHYRIASPDPGLTGREFALVGQRDFHRAYRRWLLHYDRKTLPAMNELFARLISSRGRNGK
jgi:hypothetical protein